jgi:hypothetical protein
MTNISRISRLVDTIDFLDDDLGMLMETPSGYSRFALGDRTRIATRHV